MAVAYTEVPVNAGQILAIPSSISVALNVNIMAVTIPLTSGVMVQAFRVTPTGLVAIPVNGQRTIPNGVVSVSPNGTYIISSNTVGNTPRFEIWRYNTSTNQYDKHSTGPTVNNTYVLSAFEWMSETTVIAPMFETGGSGLGGILTIDIVGNGSSVIFNPAGDVNNRAYSVMSSEDKTRVFFGILTGNTLTARSWIWNASAKSLSLTQTVSGGYQFGDIRKDLIVGTRPPNVSGVGRVDSFKYTNTLAQFQQGIVNSEDTPRFLADDDIVLNSSTGVRFFRVEPDGTITTQIPTPKGLEGMETITSKWLWSKFNTQGVIAASNAAAKEVKVFIANVAANLFAEAPTASATVVTQENGSVSFFAQAPTATATIETQGHTTANLFADAPKADAEILMLGSEDQVRYVVPMAPGVSVLFAEPVVATVEVLPRPYVKASFGELRSAATTSYHMDIDLTAGFAGLTAGLSGSPDPAPVIEVGFSALYSAAFGAGDPAPVVALGFQSLYSAALLAEPVSIDFHTGFGPLATSLETDMPSMDAEVSMGFQSLYSAAVLDNPIAAFPGGSFGALQTTAIASGPVVINMAPGFQKLQSGATVFVPILTTGEMGFQPLAAFVDVLIPNVIRLYPGFLPMGTFVDVMVPNVARLSPGFAALESDGFTMVPNTIRLGPGFQRLASDSYIMVPNTTKLSIGFGSMSSSLFGASTFSSDVRTVFGRLGTKMVVSPPVKLSGEIVLPFMETTGHIVVDYFAEGGFTLPFMDAAGIAEVSHRTTGDVVLPFMDAAGEMSVFYTVSGDIEMPGLDVHGSVMIVYRAFGDAVLPYLEVVGRGSDTGQSSTGNAPTLMGAGIPQSMLRTGGGVFLHFDTITIG